VGPKSYVISRESAAYEKGRKGMKWKTIFAIAGGLLYAILILVIVASRSDLTAMGIFTNLTYTAVAVGTIGIVGGILKIVAAGMKEGGGMHGAVLLIFILAAPIYFPIAEYIAPPSTRSFVWFLVLTFLLFGASLVAIFILEEKASKKEKVLAAVLQFAYIVFAEAFLVALVGATWRFVTGDYALWLRIIAGLADLGWIVAVLVAPVIGVPSILLEN
jgi:hypothetical protein